MHRLTFTLWPFNIKDAVFLSDTWVLIVWHVVTERYTFSLHCFTQYVSKLAYTYFINSWANFLAHFIPCISPFKVTGAHNNLRNAYWIVMKFDIKEFYTRLCNYIIFHLDQTVLIFIICMCACVCEHVSIHIPALHVWTFPVMFIFISVARMLGDHKSCVVPDL
jgi:hypothetical protein